MKENNKIPQEIEEKILKYIKDKAKREGYKWETTKHLQEAISLAFKEGRTQTLEKVKEEISKIIILCQRAKSNDPLNEYWIGQEIGMDKLKVIISKLEDDEVKK